MEANIYKRRANYYETDQMGIVHHTNYIRYFEEARLRFMNAVNCSCRALEDEGILIPVVEAYAKYHKSVKFDDDMIIHTTLTKFNGAKMEFYYEIYLEGTGELAVTGRTGHCFVTKEERTPVSIKRKFPEFFARIKQQVSAEP